MRTLLAFKLGVWAGISIAAAFAKRAVPSRGDEESDEVALVAIFDGIDLKSRAATFRGGSMLASPVLTVDGVAPLGGVAVGSGYPSNSNAAQTGQ